MRALVTVALAVDVSCKRQPVAILVGSTNNLWPGQLGHACSASVRGESVVCHGQRLWQVALVSYVQDHARTACRSCSASSRRTRCTPACTMRALCKLPQWVHMHVMHSVADCIWPGEVKAYSHVHDGTPGWTNACGACPFTDDRPRLPGPGSHMHDTCGAIASTIESATQPRSRHPLAMAAMLTDLTRCPSQN
jgi:hypothetical protein